MKIPAVAKGKSSRQRREVPIDCPYPPVHVRCKFREAEPLSNRQKNLVHSRAGKHYQAKDVSIGRGSEKQNAVPRRDRRISIRRRLCVRQREEQAS